MTRKEGGKGKRGIRRGERKSDTHRDTQMVQNSSKNRVMGGSLWVPGLSGV